jgi:hypothetical protein
VASLLSVATSQPRPPGQFLAQVQSGSVVLDGRQPSASIHYTAHLGNLSHGGDAGTLFGADLSANAFACLVGIDQFDDAGTCIETDATQARPAVTATLTSDDGGTTDTDAGYGLRLPVFTTCLAASPCTEGFTLQLTLAPNETRPVVVNYDLDLSAQGNNLADNDLVLTQP